MSRSFLLQDWTTIRSSLGSGVPLIQDPDGWLDLDGYSDVTCWIDIAEVTPPTSCVNLQLQTAPSADDAYFVALAPQLSIGGTGFTPASATPLIVRSAKTTVSNNLMRYLRWNITPAGSGTWDLTFRIHAIAARSTTFVPPLIPGCVAWYRADLGVAITAGTSTVTGWNDQSGTNDANKNLTTGVSPSFNSADPSYNGQPTITFTRSSMTYLKSATWSSAVSQPNTWIIVGHSPTPSIGEAALDCNSLAGGQNIGRNPSNKVDVNAGTSLQFANAWGAPSAALVQFNGAQSAIYFNEFTIPNTGPAGARGQNSLALGSSNPAAGPANWWDGTIAEVIGYAGILSSTSKAQLRSYIRGRYGIAIG